MKGGENQGINCIVYRDGRRVNIADYVRMALRTTAERAKLQGMSARAKELGYDTVAVSQYSMCSETCLPWQGRVYIEDVFSMWDGEIEERGDELWGKSNYCGKWFPLLSTALHKGLFHPNCRHTMTIWIDGVSPMPEKLDNSKIEANYKLEQQQRKLEREVRKAKRKVEGLSDPENIKKAKAELREKQKKLREFVNEHSDILRRDYGREKVYDDIPKKRIDNSGGSGIILGRGSGAGNPANTDHTFEKIGEIDFGDKKAVAKSLQEFEQKYKDSMIEHCRVICKNGEVYEVHGDRYTVNTELLGEKMNGSINEHNHVIGEGYYSFSWEDLESSAKDKSYISMAHDEKFRYSMMFTNAELTEDMVYGAYKRAEESVGSDLIFHPERIPIGDEQHERIKRACKELGIEYSRVPK